jgi:hypothetical protein
MQMWLKIYNIVKSGSRKSRKLLLYPDSNIKYPSYQTLSICSFSTQPVDCEHETDENTNLNSFKYNADRSLLTKQFDYIHQISIQIYRPFLAIVQVDIQQEYYQI